ncbi:MAG: hypothetical protein FWF10_08015 [Clostridiales bacterium]|nr:hypothetical protein [Clostridiales bacterium]
MAAVGRVIAYSGLDLHGVLQLSYDLFLCCLRRSVIDDLMQTEKGQELLYDWQRLNAEEPDMDAARAAMRGEIWD